MHGTKRLADDCTSESSLKLVVRSWRFESPTKSMGLACRSRGFFFFWSGHVSKTPASTNNSIHLNNKARPSPTRNGFGSEDLFYSCMPGKLLTPPNATVDTFIHTISIHNYHSIYPAAGFLEDHTMRPFLEEEENASSCRKIDWYKKSMHPLCTLVQTNLGPTPRNHPGIPSVL